MRTGRLEAFSDGVLAIIITIMVMKLKPPEGANFDSLKPLLPVFLSYVVSFIYLGNYWNGHHHLFQAAKVVNGSVLWANLHLLFWLSLIPFAAEWVGETSFSSLPMAIYGVTLLMAATAWAILQKMLLKNNSSDSAISKALIGDKKAKLSPLFYIPAIPLAFLSPWISAAIYVSVPMLWIIPDRRIEKVLNKNVPASTPVNKTSLVEERQ